MARVVITGLSMSSCLGMSVSENWNAICGKVVGLTEIKSNLVKVAGKMNSEVVTDFCTSFMPVVFI